MPLETSRPMSRKKKSASASSEAADYGTQELARRFTVVPTFNRGPMGGLSGRVVDETEIDRLLLHDRITPEQYSILEALLRRLQRASYLGLKSPNYDARISADPTIVSAKKVAAIRSMVKLNSEMDSSMGAPTRMALIDLVLLDREWPGDDASLHEAIARLRDIFT